MEVLVVNEQFFLMHNVFMAAFEDEEWDIDDDGYWEFDEVPFRVFMKFRHMLNWGDVDAGRETLQRFTQMKGEQILHMSFDRYLEIIEEHDERISNSEAPLWQQDYDRDFYSDADTDVDDDP